LAAVSLLGVAALVGGGLEYSAAVGAARGRATAAEAEAAAARELAEANEFFGLFHRARERATRPRPGWTRGALADLTAAARLKLATRHRSELLTELTNALTAA